MADVFFNEGLSKVIRAFAFVQQRIELLIGTNCCRRVLEQHWLDESGAIVEVVQHDVGALESVVGSDPLSNLPIVISILLVLHDEDEIEARKQGIGQVDVGTRALAHNILAV